MFLDSSRIGNFITTKKKDEIRIDCLFCNDEKYHLYINLSKQLFHCFRCGAKGRTNVTKDLISRFLTTKLIKESPVESDIPLKLPESCKEILTATARNYLAKRKIKESDVARHKIYSASPYSIYCGRVIIPSEPFHGFCNFFVSRSYVRYIVPKYLNPPGRKYKPFISPAMYDELHNQLWDQTTLCLVEGPFDFLKTSRHGPCMALLGKNLSEEHRRFIISAYSKVYIMLDKGIKENIAAIKIKDRLHNFVDVKIIDCPKKDPGEMNPEDFEELFK